MLGKGLESLIPQKGNPQGDAGGTSGTSPAQPIQPSQSVQPAVVPAQSAPQISPAADPSPKILEEAPEEKFLPPAQPQVARPLQPAPVRAPQTPLVSSLAQTTPAAQTVQVKRDDSKEPQSVFQIEVDKIAPNPGQPRRNFDQTALRDLANSIREFGFLQPLVVTKVERETPHGIDVEYQLIAGERRLQAAKLLGLRLAPAIVRNVSLEREKLELAVIENIQRENLNAIDTARAFQRLQEEFRMTQREIASKLGKSREVVANTVRLLDLPEYLQVAIQKGELSESNARFLLGMEDSGAQRRLFDDIVQNKLTTRDVKERVQQSGGARRGRPPKTEARLAPELKAMQESLSMDLGAPVEIQKNQNNGRITITFYSEEELENILRRLGKES